MMRWEADMISSTLGGSIIQRKGEFYAIIECEKSVILIGSRGIEQYSLNDFEFKEPIYFIEFKKHEEGKILE